MYILCSTEFSRTKHHVLQSSSTNVSLLGDGDVTPGVGMVSTPFWHRNVTMSITETKFNHGRFETPLFSDVY